MNEKEMIAFIDSLGRGGKQGKRVDGGDETLEQMGELWDELGALNLEDVKRPEAVSEFRNKLHAFQDGFAAAESRKASFEIAPNTPRESGSVIAFLRYGLVAGVAAVLTLSVYIALSQSFRANDLELQLSSTQETLALALLEQPSAPKRLEGLAAVSQIREPSLRLKDSLVRTFDTDANLNVRLAAVGVLSALPREEALSVLLDRMEKESSPLVQLEILRQVLQLVDKGSEAQMLERLEGMPLEPRVRAYVEASGKRI